MRIDVVTIFPEFFGVLDISLLGKARAAEACSTCDVARPARLHPRPAPHRRRHPLRRRRRHGHEAEPWGEALDASSAQGDAIRQSTPPHRARPGGRAVHPGDRPRARRGAVARLRLRPLRGHRPARRRPRTARMPVTSRLSLGDYVLNGGEVAVMAMIEAIGRLVPGVVGNPESLVEESHEDGLLEYPSYTKPAVWRDGSRRCRRCCSAATTARSPHWRREQQLERTAARRPDLLHGLARRRARPTSMRRVATAGGRARAARAPAACWVQEGRAQRHPRPSRRCDESLEEVAAGLGSDHVCRAHGIRVRSSGAARRRGAYAVRPVTTGVGRPDGCASCPTCRAADSGRLLEHAEATAPDGIRTLCSTPVSRAPTTCGRTRRPATAAARRGRPIPGTVASSERRR